MDNATICPRCGNTSLIRIYSHRACDDCGWHTANFEKVKFRYGIDELLPDGQGRVNVGKPVLEFLRDPISAPARLTEELELYEQWKAWRSRWMPDNAPIAMQRPASESIPPIRKEPAVSDPTVKSEPEPQPTIEEPHDDEAHNDDPGIRAIDAEIKALADKEDHGFVDCCLIILLEAKRARKLPILNEEIIRQVKARFPNVKVPRKLKTQNNRINDARRITGVRGRQPTRLKKR